MKCPSCGADNPDGAFYCGRCAVELRPPPRPEDRIGLVYGAGAIKGTREPDAMVAVAVNVRRIFILIATTLLMTLWTTLYSVFWSDLFYRSWLFVGGWALGAAIIVAIGLWYSVTKKRVTSL